MKKNGLMKHGCMMRKDGLMMKRLVNNSVPGVLIQTGLSMMSGSLMMSGYLLKTHVLIKSVVLIDLFSGNSAGHNVDHWSSVCLVETSLQYYKRKEESFWTSILDLYFGGTLMDCYIQTSSMLRFHSSVNGNIITQLSHLCGTGHTLHAVTSQVL